MLRKMTEQHHDSNKNLTELGEHGQKNSLQMTHSYSGYQLIFGKNLILPKVMNEQLPALEGTNNSKILANHLNSLHAARKAFIRSEAEEKIRRILRCKVRTAEEHYTPGELVYYKREGHEKWLGPAKVVFQDGKVIFVLHGSAVIRGSANRLTKAGVNVNLQDYSKAENMEVSEHKGDTNNTKQNENSPSPHSNDFSQKNCKIYDLNSSEGFEEYGPKIVEAHKIIKEGANFSNIKIDDEISD